MLAIEKNIPLHNLNTFGLPAYAQSFVAINNLDELKTVSSLNKGNSSYFILGGGSNMLLTKDIDALVLKNNIKGIEVLQEDDKYVYLKVGGGEVWHEFVMYCVAHGYGGIENLALIPGTVGAAPIQNIGAYGVEVKDVIAQVHTYNLVEDSMQDFSNKACEFGYRESIFKHRYKNKLFVYAITFKLNKIHNCNISYGDIAKTLEVLNLPLSIQGIASAVMHIRTEKLPDPKKIGNSGSFFKNPEIDAVMFETLKAHYSSIPGYVLSNGNVKVPAAWLIEQCGWKGYKNGNYGVHERQALVLVNYGGANGKDILKLSDDIIESVKQKFGITLVREVQVV